LVANGKASHGIAIIGKAGAEGVASPFIASLGTRQTFMRQTAALSAPQVPAEPRHADYPPLVLPLRSRRLVVRDFTSGDLGALHAYAERREVTKHLLWGPNTVEQSRATLAEFLNQQQVSPRLRYDLALALPGGKAIGGVSLHLDDLRLGNAEIGYVLHSDYWGGGFVSEAVRLVAEAAFAQWPLNRLWARCVSDNKASRRVLERMGMRHEGTLLKAERLDDRWHDVLIYALLADEWQASDG
jgi:RimJ/RimL family protein N-acetyltransferase